MSKNPVISIALFTCLMFQPAMAVAADTAKEASQAVRAQKVMAVCSTIAENIKKGGNIKRLVKTSIQMGFPACPIIRCSIENNGEPEQVISGAIESGTGPDVASRCALAAGAVAADVAAILAGVSSPGICYVMPESPEILVKPTIPVISPSRF